MRSVRLLQVALHNPADAADPDERVRVNRENVLTLLDRAAAYDPDLVVFPELALTHATRSDFDIADVAQPVPGPATDAVGERARDLDSYVLLPTYERAEGSLYNAAALIAPDGDVQGVYRKVAPASGELADGIAPGEEIPTWDTPFGRVGVCICWDVRYAEVGAALGRGGAELVLHPTLGSGHDQLRHWAQYHGYHVAFCDKSGARVYTPRGNTLGTVERAWKGPAIDADLHGGSARVSFTELNLDCRSYSRAGIGHDTLGELQRTYAGRIAVHAANREGIVVVESLDEDLHLDEVEADFEGLVRTRDFEDRVRERVHGRADSPLQRFDPTGRSDGEPRSAAGPRTDGEGGGDAPERESEAERETSG